MWIIATDAGGIIAIAIGTDGAWWNSLYSSSVQARRHNGDRRSARHDLNDMRTLNEEFRATADRLRAERDECGEQVEKLRGELREVHGGVDRIEKKLDE
jgi:uncharacterized coiled-coil DUF342 family protein